jgi:hypothetical protein
MRSGLPLEGAPFLLFPFSLLLSLALLGMFVFVAGCGGDDDTSESMTATAIISSAAEATEARTPTPTPAPTPTPSPSPRPVTAVGSLSCDPAVENTCYSFATSFGINTITLNFDLIGGPIEGTIRGEDQFDSPSCTFHYVADIKLGGYFDAVSRQFAGTSVYTTSYGELLRGFGVEACERSVNGEVAPTPPQGPIWTAILSQDGVTIVGRFGDDIWGQFSDFTATIQ